MSILTGHRGSKGEWPENTILGMNKAIESGCRALEIDVHKTKDNKVVVIHDPTIDRTSDGLGHIKDLSYSELLDFDFGHGEKIPLLNNVIKLYANKGIHLLIESKITGIADVLIKVILENQAEEYCTIISFHHQLLLEIKKMDCSIRVGTSCFCNPIDPIELMNKTDSNLFMVSITTIDENLVNKCHSAGKKIAVFNANTKVEFEEMKKLDVDYILTDYPKELGNLIKES